jgi:hypothetical protein
LRPSPNEAKEAQRRATAKALQEYLDQGGTIQKFGPDAYKREAGTLSRDEVVKTFAYQSQIGKISKEHQRS